MSGDWDEDLCKKALMLVEELCFNSPRGYAQSEHCQEFSYLLRGQNRPLDQGNNINRYVIHYPLNDPFFQTNDWGEKGLNLNLNHVCKIGAE